MLTTCCSNVSLIADLQRTPRAGQNHLQPESGAAPTATSVASPAGQRNQHGAVDPAADRPAGGTGSRSVRGPARAPAADPGQEPRRQTKLVHFVLIEWFLRQRKTKPFGSKSCAVIPCRHVQDEFEPNGQFPPRKENLNVTNYSDVSIIMAK